MKGNRNRTTLAALALGTILLTTTVACTAENKGPQVSQTDGSRPNTSESGTASPAPSSESTTAATGSASDSPSATPGAGDTAGASPAPAATALSWKTYTDPAKTVSFELPEDWIAQSSSPDAGSLAGALKVEVKDSAGRYIATLKTGIPAASPVACPAGQSHPYVVISSVPLDIPHAGGPDTIDPRVVFRVIQGYKYFGSYGITNVVAGADGQSCELRNRVLGPATKGDYSFGDVDAVHAFAVDEKVAPAKSFDTLDQAAKYVAHGSDFANVQRMLLSLKVNL
ncbi:hypothetical protein ACIQC5_04140 [Paenarthrobacter sp. NPDC092416]|uniref:hypothetical protein n=1 Tax=Paenarthrobacter sp. NPDC092416 TaxID=3364386 RepID=UPI0037F5E5DD